MKVLRFSLIGISIAGMTLLGILFINWYTSSSLLPYFQKVSNISIPGHITPIAEFDNLEFEAVGKYQLQEKALKGFLRSHPFHPIDVHFKSHFMMYSKANLVPMADTIPLSDPTHLQYFKGSNASNSWQLTVNEITGELWIEFRYPDFSGQPPP